MSVPCSTKNQPGLGNTKTVKETCTKYWLSEKPQYCGNLNLYTNAT